MQGGDATWRTGFGWGGEWCGAMWRTGVRGSRSPQLVIDHSSLLGVLLLAKLDRQYLKSQRIVFLSTGQLEILCKVYVSLFSYPVAQVD